VLVTVGIWLFYGVGLAVRYVAGHRGTWLTYFATGGFVLLLVALFAAVALFPSSHAFG
jgi:hypothetical protein